MNINKCTKETLLISRTRNAFCSESMIENFSFDIINAEKVTLQRNLFITNQLDRLHLLFKRKQLLFYGKRAPVGIV